MLTPSWPRFLAVGDKAYFGGVVQNQLKTGGKATVSIESLDPNDPRLSTASRPSTSSRARRWKCASTPRPRQSAKRASACASIMGKENDAFEDVIPVRVLVSPETVAAYGEANPRAEEKIELPENVVPGFGGLHVDLSSTAMVGLGEGARYLIEYPYGCAEQRSSRSLGLMLAADLGEAFTLPGIDATKAKTTVQTNLNEL